MAEREPPFVFLSPFQRKLEALYNSAKRWSSVLLQGNHKASDRLRRPGSFLLISVTACAKRARTAKLARRTSPAGASQRNEPKKNAFPDKANLPTASVTGFFDAASMPWQKTPHFARFAVKDRPTLAARAFGRHASRWLASTCRLTHVRRPPGLQALQALMLEKREGRRR